MPVLNYQKSNFMIQPLLKLLFRFCIVVASGWGLAIMFGVTAGSINFYSLVFYTVLSNTGIFLAYLGLIVMSIVRSIQKRQLVAVDYPPVVMGGLMAMIALTGIIYNFVLAPTISPDLKYAVNTLSNQLVHTIVPISVFIDWLLFADKKRTVWWHPFAWTVIPLAYFAFAIVRAQLGGPILGGTSSQYPYFFIDIDAYGLAMVLRNVAGIVLAFLVLSYLLIGIGKLLAKVPFIRNMR